MKKLYKTILHTYREDSPIMGNIDRTICLPYEFDLNDYWDDLILEISDLSTKPECTYITRHSDDVTPEAVLLPKKKENLKFVDDLGDVKYTVPTAWFVIFSETPNQITEIKEELDSRNIKYWENYEGEVPEISQIPPDGSYAVGEEEGGDFFRFLHHTTQISIDLLQNDKTGAKEKLVELRHLEVMAGPDIDTKIDNLKLYLEEKSPYYNDIEDKDLFWNNFRIVHPNEDETLFYSWPHFLFNTVGRKSTK